MSNADWIAIAIESIDAIEGQNWDAYHANKLTIAGYDAQAHYNRIKQRIALLIALRNAIVREDSVAVRSLLNSAYIENVVHLNNMGIPVDNSHISEMQFV